MADDRLTIDSGLVRRLIEQQFPQWATLPVEKVPVDGWDNTTFRLGDDLKVRLPTAARYVAQVEKEYRWLPYLAAFLPLAVPVPVAVGAATAEYPFPWAVYQWIGGDRASTEKILDLNGFALDLAQFIIALQRIPVDGGPLAGPHSFFRGGPLSVYDSETRRCLEELGNEIDAVAASAVWEAALASRWSGPDVWVHGDIAAGNLLVVDGKLSAVIDFGSCAVGDPACDLVIAWTLLRNSRTTDSPDAPKSAELLFNSVPRPAACALLTSQSRMAFRSAIASEETIWARARGWALWKALLTLSGEIDQRTGDSLVARDARRVIEDVLGVSFPSASR